MKMKNPSILFLLCISIHSLAQDLSSGLLERSEVPEKYKWDTKDIYISEVEWHMDYRWIESQISGYSNFRGKLAESPALLLNCLLFDEELRKRMDYLWLYAKLNRDVEMHNEEALLMWSAYEMLHAKVEAARSFIKPEIISFPEEGLDQFMAREDSLRPYAYLFKSLQNQKSHTLPPDREEFLAAMAPVLENPYNVFGSLVYAELPFPVIQNDLGEDLQLNRSTSWRARSSQDREYRQTAFQTYYQSLGNYQATLTRNLSGFVEGKVLMAGTRNYKSTLEASLNRYQIPVDVYHMLIASVGDNLQPLHRWMALKKKLLKLDTLYLYDTRVSVFRDFGKNISWEEAKQLTLESLSVLGEYYQEDIQRAYENRWIDAFPNIGKETGGYSSGPMGPHPYVKMNWGAQLFDFYTLVHELGHYVHALETMNSQPYIYRDYPPFLAEVASSTAENISQLYLINKARGLEKLYQIEQYLDNVVLNIYNSCMMAEFELGIYEVLESGKALTPGLLNKKYGQLLSRYYGPHVVIEDSDYYAWMEYPHYYLDFYLYSYATSFSAGIQIAADINSNDNSAAERFKAFLQAGNSDYPVEILKKAGVDMTSPLPYQAVSEMMNELMDILLENM